MSQESENNHQAHVALEPRTLQFKTFMSNMTAGPLEVVTVSSGDDPGNPRTFML